MAIPQPFHRSWPNTVSLACPSHFLQDVSVYSPSPEGSYPGSFYYRHTSLSRCMTLSSYGSVISNSNGSMWPLRSKMSILVATTGGNGLRSNVGRLVAPRKKKWPKAQTLVPRASDVARATGQLIGLSRTPCLMWSAVTWIFMA